MSDEQTKNAQLTPDEEVARAVFTETTPEERGFAPIFDTQIKPFLVQDVIKRRQAKAETRRRLYIYLAVTAAAIAGAVFAFRFSFHLGNPSWPAQAAALAAMAVIFGGPFWFLQPGLVDYSSVPQDAAIGLVAARFGLTYDQNKTDASVLKDAFVQPGGGFEVSLGQRLWGKRGTADLEAWPIFRYTRHYKRHGSTIETFYSGWYLRLRLPMTIKSRTAVMETSAGYQVAGGLGGLQEISLESHEFMERFRVYGDDQVEARVILSPDVIAHLERSRTTFKGRGGIIVGVSGGHADLAVATPLTPLYYWTPQVPAKVVEELHGYFKEIGDIMRFVDGFDTLVEAEGWRGEAQS